MNIIKKSKDVYVIEPFGEMKVPVEIYASEAILENLQKDKSLQQAINVACMPGIVEKSIIMPDGHQGYGFPIGGVAAFDAVTGCISPGGIGFDINCGVRAQATSLSVADVEPKLQQLIDEIYSRIPVGQGGESTLRLSVEELDDVLANGMSWAQKKGYATQDDVERCEASGRLADANPAKVPAKAKTRGKNQIATLGGGNHFVELQVVEEILDKNIAAAFRITHVGQIIVMIHSGSRGLGHQTCSEYLRTMEDAFPEIADALPEKDLIYAPLSSSLAQDYFGAMCACANFAWVNRFMMAHAATGAIKKVFPNATVESIYDVAHNIAKKEEHVVNGVSRTLMVHRKGATRAFPANHSELPECYKKTGHPVLIPGSMGTPSYILVGTPKGFSSVFGSTAHGSGRVMSRHRAGQEFDGEKVAAELKARGIIVKAPKLSGIADEAPGVYKNSAEVVGVNEDAGISKIVVKMRPLGVIKG